MDLVDATLELCKRNQKGLYNIANSGTPTMEAFADKALTLIGKKSPINIVKDLHKTKMPKVTLSTSKYNISTKKPLRDWEDALKECLYRLERYEPS